MRLRRGRLYAATYQLSTVAVAMIRLLALTFAFVLPFGEMRRQSLRSSFAKWVKLLRWGLRMEGWSRQAA
jgi:hypothetical protein